MRARLVAITYQGLGASLDPACVAPHDFRAQVAELRGAIDPARLRRSLPPRPCVVVTFDTGEASVRIHALPILRAAGVRAALFMTTAWIGRPGYLEAADLRALYAEGWLIGSHGHTRRLLRLLRPRELADELTRSRARLDEILGVPPSHLSFPEGRTIRAVEEAAWAAGFTQLWSSVPGSNVGSEAVLRRTTIPRGLPLHRFRRILRGGALANLRERLRQAPPLTSNISALHARGQTS